MFYHYQDAKAGTTVAIAKNCKLDAIHKIIKRYPFLDEDDAFEIDGTLYLAHGLEKALIQDTFKVIVKVYEDGGDVWDASQGINEADKKLQAKIDASIEKAINRWIQHNIKLLNCVKDTKKK